MVYLILFFVSCYLTHVISAYIKYRHDAGMWPYWKIVKPVDVPAYMEDTTFSITNGNKYLDFGTCYLSLNEIPKDMVRVTRVKWVAADDLGVTVFHDKETAEKVLYTLHKYYKTGGGISLSTSHNPEV